MRTAGPPDDAGHPPPGSPGERRRFAELQERLAPLFRRVFHDRHAPQTVVVVPSMSLDAGELAKLAAATHYEERLLCLLMLLRQPRTHVVYVTSAPVDPAIVDYYLHLLPGVPPGHARRRLTLLACDDDGATPLTAKLLARPALLARIGAAVADPESAHLTCFNATALERTLAVRLGIPLYACDPALAHLGTKSGSRELFRRAGVALPDGFERLRDVHDVAGALVALRRADPTLRRAVVKLDEGFSGEGNATFAYDGAPGGAALAAWVRDELPTRLRFEAAGETWERYLPKLAAMGGVAECFLEGADARSPSVQCRVDPLRRASIISTHDQLLGGPSGQVYWGCTFPAAGPYRADIQDAGLRVAALLADEGVLGRFAVDFVSVRRGDRWESAAIEVNLRKGGTTHPYLTLQFLTDGAYDPDTGTYRSAAGRPCCYCASDNLGDPAYLGLTPDALLDIAVCHDLHFDAATQRGVTFHLLGALPAYGKLGAVAVGESHAAAERYFRGTVDTLLRAAWRRRGGA
ncbi:peptide ligase PGM1-related protein [Roseisolibacter sp. H3M3-2]|uniref:peptide ligase PGM1-related protein n=1 Tax=Roseisolibacter sp. H3M3-2 TaxID=3031323 RepID=UPI0023DA8AC7|nr:peptide ligase PGM1-related protein [Roseisolibacter sp. H3M3-2]MDF1501383.1 peptide ligase PGM1-related protein [Roseisolibacter sp. H3M3-2]